MITKETQEYLEIMAGRKRLQLEYKAGDLVSGYTAYGLDARIIESLHCGQYVDGWGFLVDREFEDGDIGRMKRHFFEWKEMQEVQEQLIEEEKERLRQEEEKLLKGVQWKKQEKYGMDGGRSYHHEITIEGRRFCFCEQKIQGMGRVIVPEYEVEGDILGDPMAVCDKDTWYWSFVKEGKEEKKPMESAEARAYEIIYRCGMHPGSKG